VMLVAVMPLNVTVLVPCVDPKPDPAIVIEAPTAPDVGLRLEMFGAALATWGAMSRARSAMSRDTPILTRDVIRDLQAVKLSAVAIANVGRLTSGTS
jgi:hypothetical protein